MPPGTGEAGDTLGIARVRRAALTITKAAGIGLGILCLAAAADYLALKQHLDAGPFMFTGANCAGTRSASTIPQVTDPTAGATIWPTLEAGAARDASLAADPLSASWTFQTNGSVVMAPSVVDGVAYMGSMDGCVYALDVATGRLLWSFAANNQVMSEPVVVGGEVIFGSGNKGMGRLPSGGIVRGTGISGIYALNARTGTQLWFQQTLGEDMPTPTVSNGVVYEGTGGQMFYAIDAKSGQVLWSLPLGSYVSMSSPTVVGNVAIVGGATPYRLIGVDLGTHEIAWTLPLPQAPGGVDDITATAVGGIAYVQVPQGKSAPHIVEIAVQAQTGRVLWQRVLGTDRWNLLQRAMGQGTLAAQDGEEAAVASVSGGVLYVGAAGLHGVWALNAATGQPVWSRPANVPATVRTSPLVAGGRVYVTTNNHLYVLAAATGAVQAQRVLGRWSEGTGIMIPCTTPAPTLVGNTLLVGTGQDTAAITALPLQTVLGGHGG